MSSPAATLILDRSTVGNLLKTYVLGCYSKRVTFHSQQNRALNLIWALFDTGNIKAGSRVAIVGGGLAGITAATGAFKKGCDVTVYEGRDQVMHIQRGNFTRYIHPNIYDWPRQGCTNNATDLPFLNWTANTTDNVINQIESEWNIIATDVDVKTNHKVNSISQQNGKPRISVIDPFVDEEYDCVIIAAGFGLEQTMDNVQRRFYWNSDDLHQPVKSEKKQHESMVSGNGDGGLIDVLRLSIKDFKHEDFTQDFLENSNLEAFKNQLVHIEENIPVDCEDVSRYLHDAYKKIKIPDELNKKIKRRLRTDTKVSMVGATSTPFNINASLLNRAAILLLIQNKNIAYRKARVISAQMNQQTYSVTIDSDGIHNQLTCDEVVLRHGPKPVINELIANGSVFKVGFDHETAQPHWPESFYPRKEKPAPGQFEIAEKNKKSLMESIIKGKNISEVGVSIAGTEEHPIYLVGHNGSLASTIIDNYTNHEGFPVVYFLTPNFTQSMNPNFSVSRRNAHSADAIVLSAGAQIKNKANRGGTGTLGCFVSLPNGSTALLSTNHVLVSNDQKDDRIVLMNEDGKSGKEIGKLFRSSSISTFNGRITSGNIIDAAIATLKPGVQFSPFFQFKAENYIIKEATDPFPGRRVMKIGAGSGETEGTIKAVNGSFFINYGNEKKLFSDAILIEGEKNAPFSSAGDSGALVFDDNGFAYGIILGTSANYTLACPLKPILEQLECRIYSM